MNGRALSVRPRVAGFGGSGNRTGSSLSPAGVKVPGMRVGFVSMSPAVYRGQVHFDTYGCIVYPADAQARESQLWPAEPVGVS